MDDYIISKVKLDTFQSKLDTIKTEVVIFKLK